MVSFLLAISPIDAECLDQYRLVGISAGCSKLYSVIYSRPSITFGTIIFLDWPAQSGILLIFYLLLLSIKVQVVPILACLGHTSPSCLKVTHL